VENISGKNLTLLKSIFDQKNRRKEIIYKIVVKDISHDDKEYAINMVVDDFCRFGLDDNDEPTETGILLEGIIDFINNIPIMDDKYDDSIKYKEMMLPMEKSLTQDIFDKKLSLLKAIFTQEKCNRKDIIYKIITGNMEDADRKYALDVLIEELCNYGFDDNDELTNAGILMEEIISDLAP